MTGHIDDLRDDRVAELEHALVELRAENDAWRAAYAYSDKPCKYCALSADALIKCAYGFPGCPRADDMMLCPHVGEVFTALQALAALLPHLAHIKDGASPEVDAARKLVPAPGT